MDYYFDGMVNYLDETGFSGFFTRSSEFLAQLQRILAQRHKIVYENRKRLVFLNMKIWRQAPSIVQFQVLIWIAVLLLIFFSLLPMDGLPKSVIYHGSQRNIVCNHYLWEYPVLYPVFYQKRRFVLYGISVASLFNFDRNAKGLRRHYPLQVFSVDKNRPGSFA